MVHRHAEGIGRGDPFTIGVTPDGAEALTGEFPPVLPPLTYAGVAALEGGMPAAVVDVKAAPMILGETEEPSFDQKLFLWLEGEFTEYGLEMLAASEAETQDRLDLLHEVRGRFGAFYCYTFNQGLTDEAIIQNLPDENSELPDKWLLVLGKEYAQGRLATYEALFEARKDNPDFMDMMSYESLEAIRGIDFGLGDAVLKQEQATFGPRKVWLNAVRGDLAFMTWIREEYIKKHGENTEDELTELNDLPLSDQVERFTAILATYQEEQSQADAQAQIVALLDANPSFAKWEKVVALQAEESILPTDQIKLFRELYRISERKQDRNLRRQRRSVQVAAYKQRGGEIVEVAIDVARELRVAINPLLEHSAAKLKEVSGRLGEIAITHLEPVREVGQRKLKTGLIISKLAIAEMVASRQETDFDKTAVQFTCAELIYQEAVTVDSQREPDATLSEEAVKQRVKMKLKDQEKYSEELLRHPRFMMALSQFSRHPQDYLELFERQDKELVTAFRASAARRRFLRQCKLPANNEERA
jgi:hypothetical protein